MNPQLIVATVWLASLVGVGIWQNVSGRESERMTFMQRDFADLSVANGKIVELTEKLITETGAHATRLSLISQRYEKEKQDESKKRDRVIADLRAERVRLRDPGSTSPAGNSESGVTPSTGKCDGEARPYLSIETSEFLVRLTGEADEVAHQLTECQAVVMSDRGMTAQQIEGEVNEQ